MTTNVIVLVKICYNAFSILSSDYVLSGHQKSIKLNVKNKVRYVVIKSGTNVACSWVLVPIAKL